jgi:hypothetical protein
MARRESADEPHFRRLSSDPQPTTAKIKPAVQSAPARISALEIAMPSAAMVPSDSAMKGAAINHVAIFAAGRTMWTIVAFLASA